MKYVERKSFFSSLVKPNYIYVRIKQINDNSLPDSQETLLVEFSVTSRHSSSPFYSVVC